VGDWPRGWLVIVYGSWILGGVRLVWNGPEGCCAWMVDIELYERVVSEGEGEDKETLWVRSNSFNDDLIFNNFSLQERAR
jgi:hypothetical protein